MQRATLHLSLAAAILTFACFPAQAQDKFLDKIKQVLPESAPAESKQPRKLLIYSKTLGFRHSSIPVGIKAITMMGDKTGAYTVYATEDASFFDPEKLKKFDAVLMLNTTGDCLRPIGAGKETGAIEERRKKSLIDFVSSGKGLIGIHSATDTYRNWKEYNKMMGGAFVSHPWNSNSKVHIKNLEPTHPVNAAFDGKGFSITDEIYMFRDDTALPTERKFLLVLDGDKMDLKKQKRKDGQFPISWVSTYGKGRVFYCSLGHREDIYWNPAILKHYLAGMQYTLGDLEADAAPSKKAEDGK